MQNVRLYCQTPVIFAWDNKKKKKKKKKKNPHLSFLKRNSTRGFGTRGRGRNRDKDKGKMIRDKG